MLGCFSPWTSSDLPGRPVFAVLGFPQNRLLFMLTHRCSDDFGSGHCVSHLRDPLLSWSTRQPGWNPVQLQGIYISLFTCGVDSCHLSGLLFATLFGHKKGRIGDKPALSSTHTQKNPTKKPDFKKVCCAHFVFRVLLIFVVFTSIGD